MVGGYPTEPERKFTQPSFNLKVSIFLQIKIASKSRKSLKPCMSLSRILLTLNL